MLNKGVVASTFIALGEGTRWGRPLPLLLLPDFDFPYTPGTPLGFEELLLVLRLVLSLSPRHHTEDF